MNIFNFPGQTAFYKGKVRDVYTIYNKYLVMVASNRISAFDVVLPRPIPYKGQVLNQNLWNPLYKSDLFNIRLTDAAAYGTI